MWCLLQMWKWNGFCDKMPSKYNFWFCEKKLWSGNNMFQIVNRIDVIMQQYIVLHVLNTFIDLILYMLEFKYICFTSITFAVVLLWTKLLKICLKSTLCSYLQIIKTVSNKIWDIQNQILDLNIFSVYGHVARKYKTIYKLHQKVAKVPQWAYISLNTENNRSLNRSYVKSLDPTGRRMFCTRMDLIRLYTLMNNKIANIKNVKKIKSKNKSR